MKTVLDVQCPACHVPIQVDCDWTGWKYAQPHPDFHTKRFDAAMDANEKEQAAQSADCAPTVAEFDRAVEESGRA